MGDQNKTVCFFLCQIGFSLFSELATSFQWEELATYASTSWQSQMFLAGGRRTYLGKGCRRPTWSFLPAQVIRSPLPPWRGMQHVSPVVPALQKVKPLPYNRERWTRYSPEWKTWLSKTSRRQVLISATLCWNKSCWWCGICRRTLILHPSGL